MKFVVIALVVLVFACLPLQSRAAGFGLPWFHTRPKTVILDDSPAEQSRAPVRKPVSWSNSGRPDFRDASARRMQPPVKPQPADDRSRTKTSR